MALFEDREKNIWVGMHDVEPHFFATSPRPFTKIANPSGSRNSINLMLNGIEAMKETGGVLTVKTGRGEGGQVLISVSDTGVGLPARRADEIFNAFFTTKLQGSGMGLAISRSIVESHGGRLWATSNDGTRRDVSFHPANCSRGSVCDNMIPSWLAILFASERMKHTRVRSRIVGDTEVGSPHESQRTPWP
jgi:Histidine kinase-, DNA gyrase B-, and HSP90-like ATPase